MRYEKEMVKKELNETGKKILAAAESCFWKRATMPSPPVTLPGRQR